MTSWLSVRYSVKPIVLAGYFKNWTWADAHIIPTLHYTSDPNDAIEGIRNLSLL